MSRSSAPEVLERTGIEGDPACDVDSDEAPSRPAAPTPSGRRVTRGGALPVPSILTGHPLARVLTGRRLPHPPGRRAPLWFAALVAGALLAMLPSLLGSPVAVTNDASDYGLGAGSGSDISFTGGIEDAGARRSITEAEAQARLLSLIHI